MFPGGDVSIGRQGKRGKRDHVIVGGAVYTISKVDCGQFRGWSCDHESGKAS